jgi:uncharacterized protein (DUF1330 family)
MTAYVIYQAEIVDPVRYEDYKDAAEATILAAGGRYIVRGGDVEVFEGDPPVGRTVILEFPSMESAVDWYRSSDYTAARAMRDGVAIARVFLVDGIA